LFVTFSDTDEGDPLLDIDWPNLPTDPEKLGTLLDRQCEAWKHDPTSERISTP
jgi:hypothetical protein